ncbi:DUF7674 family protein [Brucella intermedia]|uniref:DUF7674 family protein n=1 Tax=Brucella intermedia TaxID=94625 RepID=UPI00124DEE00|nr:hypothetical protein [Brucella intermedia]KAB2717749.1 hypothetical protein F9L02_23540 [Brucella intermedia]
MITNSRMFVSNLANKFEMLRGILDEHLQDNFGEILPHILMADYCRIVLSSENDVLWVERFLSEIEDHFSDVVDDEVSNVIAVSFIEHLPPPDKHHQIVEKLGKKLKTQYSKTFGLQ